jgi:hypothetical protein
VNVKGVALLLGKRLQQVVCQHLLIFLIVFTDYTPACPPVRRN